MNTKNDDNEISDADSQFEFDVDGEDETGQLKQTLHVYFSQ